MRAFACPVCHGFVPFEAPRCRPARWPSACHLPTREMVALTDGAAEVAGQRWVRVHPARAPGLQLADARGGRRRHPQALPGRLADRRRPDPDDTIAGKLVPTRGGLRRLIYQLVDIGLPVDPYWRRDGGLAFDLLSSYSTGGRSSSATRAASSPSTWWNPLDAYRESLRVRLGSPTGPCSAISGTRPATTTRTSSSRPVPARASPRPMPCALRR